MDTVGLELPAITLANFPGDMPVPPIGGQSIGALVLLCGFDGDVVRAFEPDDVRSLPGNDGIAAAISIRVERQAEFRTGIVQGIEVPDLSLDGGEV